MLQKIHFIKCSLPVRIGIIKKEIKKPKCRIDFLKIDPKTTNSKFKSSAIFLTVDYKRFQRFEDILIR